MPNVNGRYETESSFLRCPDENMPFRFQLHTWKSKRMCRQIILLPGRRSQFYICLPDVEYQRRKMKVAIWKGMVCVLMAGILLMPMVSMRNEVSDNGVTTLGQSEKNYTGQKMISLQFTEPLVMKSDGYASLDIAGANARIQRPGSPALPFYITTLNFPQGTEIIDISCEVLEITLGRTMQETILLNVSNEKLTWLLNSFYENYWKTRCLHREWNMMF